MDGSKTSLEDLPSKTKPYPGSSARRVEGCERLGAQEASAVPIGKFIGEVADPFPNCSTLTTMNATKLLRSFGPLFAFS